MNTLISKLGESMSRFLFIKLLQCTILIAVLSTVGFAQESSVNYNQVYRFPASVGAEVQLLSPLVLFGTDYRGEFSIVDVSLLGRFPLGGAPVLQPLVRLGFVATKAEYGAGNELLHRFDNSRIYLTAGLGYLHKFNKQFEVGGDIEAGGGLSLFPKLDSMSENPSGSWDYQVSLGGRLVFNPSYNLSLNFHPTLRYNRSFSPLVRFNGFSFGLGFSLDYRTGTDPDDPKTQIESIDFSNPRIDNIFAAMQSYYVKNSIGDITMTNTEKYPLTNLEVSFFQPGYMNIATEVASFEELGPGESKTVPLIASFDQSIFSLEGITPLTGEVRVDYTLRSRKASQTTPVVYDLYDKNSLTWDDDRKVAAFITSGDSALANYNSFLRQTTKDMVNLGYSEAVQTAIQVFYGLTELGSVYQKDPTLSYEDAKGNINFVDTVNLPRETLVKLAGDCDDLTVLFNAMLESMGIPTGFITAPGHIYSIFSTGVPARDYRLVHPEKDMTVAINGILWVPLEITYIGEDDFLSAWRSGAEEFHLYVDTDSLGLYFTNEAQQVYRPVGFQESDLGLQYGDRTRIFTDFTNDLGRVTNLVMDSFESDAEIRGDKSSYNTYGIVSARLGAFDRAEEAFNNALVRDRNYISPKVNLANVYYLREEYQNALRLFHDAERVFEDNGDNSSSEYARILLNIARTYYELENFDLAAEYSRILARINPTMAARFDYLGVTEDDKSAELLEPTGAQYLEEN